jgi:hypothetical protein
MKPALADMTKEELGSLYEKLIGYDPFSDWEADQSSLEFVEEVREILLEYVTEYGME